MLKLLLFVLIGALSVHKSLAVLVTNAYLGHLFARYGGELSRIISSTSEAPSLMNETMYQCHLCDGPTLFGELLYMQVRDSALKNILELGMGNDLSTTFWTLLALNKATGTPKMYFASDKSGDAVKRIKTFRDSFAPNVQVDFLELSTVLQPASFAPFLSSGIDGLIVNIRGQRQPIIKNMIEPLLAARSIEDSALHLFFHVLDPRNSKPSTPEHRNIIQ